VKAYAGDYNTGDYSGSAGIGAGGKNTSDTHTGGNIKILGGNVTAGGSYSSLDIGRGRGGVNGTLLIDGAAQVTLLANGIDSSATTFGTCILQGPGAGSLLGAYEGTKIDGVLIDMGNPSLASGTGYTVSGNTVTLAGSGNSYVLFGSTTVRNVVVSSGANANVTLFAASIQPVSESAFNMTGTTVNMRLVKSSTLTGADNSAGIQAPAGSALTISGSATSTLTSQGGANAAGIGGGNNSSGGVITIKSSVTVDARGGNGGAGIGGGRGGAGGTVLADGAQTTVSTTGGGDGYDIGSGSGSSAGGSLSITNNATVLMNKNGTNANASISTGTVGGSGAGLLAGTYLDSQKLLSISSFTASPESEVKAYQNVTLTANVTGLSYTEPQGQIVFFDGGTEIGRSSLTRVSEKSENATSEIVWLSRGGTHAFTAQYIQNETADSYYTTGVGQIADYTVARTEQAMLFVSGIPGTVTYGDHPFSLSVIGGSGTGGLSYEVTSGGAVSISPSGSVTVLKAGTAEITVTRAGDADYLPVSAVVPITVNKAVPPPVIFPSAGAIIYEQKLSDSPLTGGSGNGSFAWEDSDIVPLVQNSGYTVVFTPADTDNYDYTGITLSQTVNITVNKAVPKVTFPSAGQITYEQPLSASALTGGNGNGSFSWEDPDIIPTVVNSGYRVIFTPDDTDNYQTVTDIVPISVLKAEQADLVIDGIPDPVAYGASPFDLIVSGGSGTGGLSYETIEGNAISVDTKGTVTIQTAGEATVKITKASDSNYNAVYKTVKITVNKAVPYAIFPSAGQITYGQALSASILTGGSGDGSFAWENPETIPTVINNGFNVVFTPFDTDNYLPIKQAVTLTVDKADQAPLSVSGIPDTLTFGDKPFRPTVSGGSGTGSLGFAVVSGNAITVDASGKITIAHAGTAAVKITNFGDDNYLPVSRTFLLTVNKAKQSAALTFSMPDTIAVGDAPFTIVGSGGNGSGAFGFSVASGNSIYVTETGTVTVLSAGEAVITAVKAGDGDYLSREGTIRLRVDKGTQNALIISGIPQTIIAGQAPFNLNVYGGSGTGELSYAVASGKAVNVDANGLVTILKAGTAMLKVTKAADANYNDATATVEINVKRALPTKDSMPTSSSYPAPSSAPSSTVTPGPSPDHTFAAPTESPADVTLKPLAIQSDEPGMLIVTISTDDLPEGTTAIRLQSGQIIQIDTTKETFELELNQEDIADTGEFEVVALNSENMPLSKWRIDLTNETSTQNTLESRPSLPSIWFWAAGVPVIGAAIAASVIWHRKRK